MKKKLMQMIICYVVCALIVAGGTLILAAGFRYPWVGGGLFLVATGLLGNLVWERTFAGKEGVNHE